MSWTNIPHYLQLVKGVDGVNLGVFYMRRYNPIQHHSSGCAYPHLLFTSRRAISKHIYQPHFSKETDWIAWRQLHAIRDFLSYIPDRNTHSFSNNALRKLGNPDSKIHGANMGSIWGRQVSGGPHIDPMNLSVLSGMECQTYVCSTRRFHSQRIELFKLYTYLPVTYASLPLLRFIIYVSCYAVLAAFCGKRWVIYAYMKKLM